MKTRYAKSPQNQAHVSGAHVLHLETVIVFRDSEKVQSYEVRVSADEASR